MIKDKVSYTQFIFWYGRSCKKISCHCSINFENLLWLGHFAFKLYFGELPATAHSPELKTTGSWNFQMIYDYEPNFSLRKIDRTIVSRSFRQSLKFMDNDIIHYKGGLGKDSFEKKKKSCEFSKLWSWPSPPLKVVKTPIFFFTPWPKNQYVQIEKNSPLKTQNS